MKLEEMTPTIDVLDCQTNSPCQHLRKCIRNSLENMHADVMIDKKWLMSLHSYISGWF